VGKNSKPAEIGRARLPPSLKGPGLGRWFARRLALPNFFTPAAGGLEVRGWRVIKI